ncbi:MAG: AhpC/TSA family protein [Clostridiales bacterium]|nr:AhpC/TSA family protein [Clostridiales bacterium]
MKKNSIWTLGTLGALTAIAMQSCSNDKYEVSGNIAGYDGPIMLLQPISETETDTLGNILSPDGSFSFNGTVDAPAMARIVAGNTGLDIPVFLEGGAIIQVEADTENKGWNATGGGALQQLRNDWHARELAMKAARDSIENYYKTNYDMTDYFWVVQAKGALQSFAEECDSIENDFIAANDNMVAASLIYDHRWLLTRNKKIAAKYELLGENARASVPGQLVAGDAAKIASISVGGTAPDFTMETPQGEPISLYGIKGKIKILDFWASWCGPCRAENPNVKRIYEKYHDKGLEILSVSVDTDKDKWIEAIEADGLPWNHASELGKNTTAQSVYFVYGIPYMLILDENNKILAQGLRGEKLEQFIAEALGE